MENEKIDNIVQLAGELAAKADEIDCVLVLYQRRNGGVLSLDNDLTIANSLYLVESFKHWLMTASQKPEEKT